jgi:hypothetical protein
MDQWRALRIALFGLSLGVAVLAPEAWIAGAGVRLALSRLGTYGLLGEQLMFRDEQLFQQEKSLREMDEKSRQLQHERENEMLHELEDFWSQAPEA